MCQLPRGATTRCLVHRGGAPTTKMPRAAVTLRAQGGSSLGYAGSVHCPRGGLPQQPCTRPLGCESIRRLPSSPMPKASSAFPAWTPVRTLRAAASQFSDDLPEPNNQILTKPVPAAARGTYGRDGGFHAVSWVGSADPTREPRRALLNVTGIGSIWSLFRNAATICNPLGNNARAPPGALRPGGSGGYLAARLFVSAAQPLPTRME